MLIKCNTRNVHIASHLRSQSVGEHIPGRNFLILLMYLHFYYWFIYALKVLIPQNWI